MSDLTIKNGGVANGLGGGILVEFGATLNASNCASRSQPHCHAHQVHHHEEQNCQFTNRL